MNRNDSNKLERAYKMSFEAYKLSVLRHREWMYIYAIIEGALFIALYTLLEASSLLSIDNIKSFLVILIAFLGAITSFCWFLSFRGHYEWTKNFIRILCKNEEMYFNDGEDRGLFVYAQVIPDTEPKQRQTICHLPGFFSTQKIMLLFIRIVFLAWIFVLIFLMCIYGGVKFGDGGLCLILLPILIGMIILFIWCFLEGKKVRFPKIFYSDIHHLSTSNPQKL